MAAQVRREPDLWQIAHKDHTHVFSQTLAGVIIHVLHYVV